MRRNYKGGNHKLINYKKETEVTRHSVEFAHKANG